MWDLCTNALIRPGCAALLMETCASCICASATSPPRTARSARSRKANQSASAFAYCQTVPGASPPRNRLTREGVAACAAQAVSIAKASALANAAKLFSPRKKRTWIVGRALSAKTRSKFPRNSARPVACRRRRNAPRERCHADRNGHAISQDRFLVCVQHWLAHSPAQSDFRCGIAATSFQGEEIQKRSYPNSFGGQHALQGYELVDSLDLMRNAPIVAEEAAALHSASQCPEKVGTLILGASQLGLQIHESIGHPIELDRVLGQEAPISQARVSDTGCVESIEICVEHRKRGSRRPARSRPRSWHFAYDDEGVPAQCTDIIKQGNSAAIYPIAKLRTWSDSTALPEPCAPKAGTASPSFDDQCQFAPAPGTTTILIADTHDGILMETNRSWSIDDRRYQFQFPPKSAGNQRRKESPHVEKSELQRYYHRVLEFL